MRKKKAIEESATPSLNPFDALSLARGKPSDANRRIRVTRTAHARVSNALSKRQRVEWADMLP
jgi:hypothetical protein